MRIFFKVTSAIMIAAITALALFSGIAGAAAEAPQISVEIDGRLVDFPDQPPVIIDGRTLVPIRGVFEQMGYEVEWVESDDMAILSNSIFTVKIKIGSSNFERTEKIGGGYIAVKTSALDVPAQVINGRTMVPLRAILESVKCSISWDEHNNKITILSPEPTEPLSAAEIAELVKGDADNTAGFNVGGPIGAQPPGTYQVCATCKGTGINPAGAIGGNNKCSACNGIGVFNKIN